jgi:hypothetical protein
MRWARHALRMGKNSNAYKLLTGKSGGNKIPGRSKHWWKDNIKMDLKDTEWVVVNLTQLAQVQYSYGLLTTFTSKSLITGVVICYTPCSRACCVAESSGVSGALPTSVLWSRGHHITTETWRQPASDEGEARTWGLQPAIGHQVLYTGVNFCSVDREQACLYETIQCSLLLHSSICNSKFPHN